MPRRYASLPFGLALLALFIGTSAPAEGLSKVPQLAAVKQAVGYARAVVAVIETINQLEEWTRTNGPAKGKAPYKATLEAVELRAKFLVRNVEAERTSFNEVPFVGKVPGSEVMFRARGDVEVSASVDLGKVRVVRDKDYPDTIVVVLPKFTVSSRPVREGELTSEIQWGRLHNPRMPISRARADELRPMVYRAVEDTAVEQFQGEDLGTYRKAFADALQKGLRAKFPKQRIHVR